MGGITWQLFEVVRAALRAAEIDTRKIYDISFVGRQVVSLPTDVNTAKRSSECLRPEKYDVNS